MPEGPGFSPAEIAGVPLFSPRYPHRPAVAGLCGWRGRETISGPCNGGAEARPFPSLVRKPDHPLPVSGKGAKFWKYLG
jgi:hypothetical protein